MKITGFDKNNKEDYQKLYEMFVKYFDEMYADDPEGPPPIEDMPEAFEWFVNDCDHEDGWIFLATDDGELAGFIFAHIDRPHKGWCAREGWGCIREIYVAPGCRKSGLGRQLMNAAENAMESFEPKGHYLTSDGFDSFWNSMGYAFTGEVEKLNGMRIFTKE